MKIKTFDNLTTLTKVTLYGRILAIFHRPLKNKRHPAASRNKTLSQIPNGNKQNIIEFSTGLIYLERDRGCNLWQTSAEASRR